MKEKIMYRCDYCGKIVAKKSTMENHEKHCLENPNGYNCWMCERAVLMIESANNPVCLETNTHIDRNIADECICYKRSDRNFRFREVPPKGGWPEAYKILTEREASNERNKE